MHKFGFLAIFACAALAGCATTTPQISPMQMRQFTTRGYDSSYENVYRATMTVFQDQGYIIKNTDMNSGLIVAEIDRETSQSSQFWQYVFSSDGYIANKGTLIQVSATVNKLNDAQSEIRMTIQEVTYGTFNSKSQIKTITDPKVYDSILNDIQIETKRREAINRPSAVATPAPMSAASAPAPQVTEHDKEDVGKAFDSALSKQA